MLLMQMEPDMRSLSLPASVRTCTLCIVLLLCLYVFMGEYNERQAGSWYAV